MIVEIKFRCDTEAFAWDTKAQIEHVLKDAVYKIMVQIDRPVVLCTEPEWADVLRDVNGNRVGTVQVME